MFYTPSHQLMTGLCARLIGLPICALVAATANSANANDEPILASISPRSLLDIQSHEDRLDGNNRYPHLIEVMREEYSDSPFYLSQFSEIENAYYELGESLRDQFIQIAHDEDLFFARDMRRLLGTGPAENVSSYFRFVSTESGYYDAWVTIGWIDFDSIETVSNNKDDCDPELRWRSCLFVNSDGQYVLRMRPGIEGWPVFGAGLHYYDHDADGPDDDLKNTGEEAMEILTSAEWSELAEDYFLVVADDSVRSEREVLVELYDRNGDYITSTLNPTPHYGRTARSRDSDSERTYNVCGTRTDAPAACPMFVINIDTRYNISPEVQGILRQIDDLSGRSSWFR